MDAQAQPRVEALSKGTVLIAGGGPVGLLVAKVLSHHGVRSALFERNKTTTRWPKMDLTNPRSMEMFRRLGISESIRRLGVPSHIDQDVLVSSGLSTEAPIAKWELPSVDRFRERIRQNNDGTQPLEAWQRISQVLFEQHLKSICDEDPLISLNFSYKVEQIEENKDSVRTHVVNIDSGQRTTFVSDYMIGCDGASSKTRQSMSFALDGGPVPTVVLLVHFKSTDLERLHKQGRFWHIFLAGHSGELSGAIISQNEVDIWTTHLFLPVDADTDSISSEDAIYRVLGGLYEKYPIKIDEILVRSTWRPYIAVSRQWSGEAGRVFIAGDAAHQNIPTGGYGMNMGIGDAYDLGWKLAAVVNGYAGRGLLQSYEEERRPVALRNVERSGMHFSVHSHMKEIFKDSDPCVVDKIDTEEGRTLRQRLRHHYETHDGENKDIGIEMDYRYNSRVIVAEKTGEEPPWQASQYTPSTWPGARAPHLFLSDGTPIFDHFGKNWTLLSFASSSCGEYLLMDAAQRMSIPVTYVNLAREKLAQQLYEKPLVLIRPDEHVAWRGSRIGSQEQAENILEIVVGRVDGLAKDESPCKIAIKPTEAFTTTVELTTHVDKFEIDRMADFQR